LPCKGHEFIDNEGYIQIYVNGEYERKHRFLMSQYLGRPLLRQEHVHHKNSNKQDNRKSNLELLTDKSHPRLHREEFRKNISSKRKCVLCGTSKTCFSVKQNYIYWHFQNHDKNKPICHNCHVKEYYKTHERPEKKSRLIHRAMVFMFSGM
jgi:hypothetical protein